MKINSLFLTLFVLAVLSSFLTAQEMSFGVQIGSNYSIPNTVIIFEGKKESDENLREGMPKAGYSVKGFGLVPLKEKGSILASIGYEQMRYESYSSGLETVRINNFGLTVTQSYTIYDFVEAFVSGEILYRWANSDGNFPALGKSVDEKIHVQGRAGLGCRRDDNSYIRLGLLFPQLNEVSNFPLGPTFERQRVERLNVLFLEIGIPLF
jgi:hypothetical protein